MRRVREGGEGEGDGAGGVREGTPPKSPREWGSGERGGAVGLEACTGLELGWWGVWVWPTRGWGASGGKKLGPRGLVKLQEGGVFFWGVKVEGQPRPAKRWGDGWGRTEGSRSGWREGD